MNETMVHFTIVVAGAWFRRWPTMHVHATRTGYGYSTRFTFDTLARAKNEQLSGTNPNMLIVLKCIKRYFTREFDISISLGGGSGRPTGTCI